MARSPEQEHAAALRRCLQATEAEKLLRVVALIDAMDHRGPADDLIQPLRSRLAALRPPRPLRFERLLFQPFDPVIVSGPRWEPDSPTIPRHALSPLARAVRLGMGRRASEVDALMAKCACCDGATIARIGGVVWPLAAESLPGSNAPPGWAEAGLRPACYAPLVQAISTGWRWNMRLLAVQREAHGPAPGAAQAAIATVIAGIAHEPILTQAMIVALLLARLPGAASLLQSAIGAFGTGAEQAALRAAVGRAVDGLTTQLEGGLEAQVSGADLPDAGDEVGRLVALLDELHACAKTSERRASVAAMRKRLHNSCRARFRTGIADALLTPLQARTENIDGAMQVQFEQAARGLRALETHGRRIGGVNDYDQLLTVAADAMRQAAAQGVLTVPRQVRLIEILAGAEAALAVLDASPAPT